ncbi:hypothetical protein V1524DRAFT_438972 [Lipomyces starkeyi]
MTSSRLARRYAPRRCWCGMLFACNEHQAENHVEGGECSAFHKIPCTADETVIPHVHAL